jgi:hypothetical protein
MIAVVIEEIEEMEGSDLSAPSLSLLGNPPSF